MLRVFRWLVLCGVFGLYAAACHAPAINADGGDSCTGLRLGTISGGQALLLGWWPPFCIPWSANLLLVAGVISLLLQRYRMAIVFGWAAVLAGLTTIPFSHFFEFRALLVGFYLWQASLLLFAVGTLVVQVCFGPPLVLRKPDGFPQATVQVERTWTDRTGQFTVPAVWVEVKGAKAVLKKTDGQVIKVPLGSLSQADHDYAQAAGYIAREKDDD